MFTKHTALLKKEQNWTPVSLLTDSKPMCDKNILLNLIFSFLSLELEQDNTEPKAFEKRIN